MISNYVVKVIYVSRRYWSWFLIENKAKEEETKSGIKMKLSWQNRVVVRVQFHNSSTLVVTTIKQPAQLFLTKSTINLARETNATK